jgi:hypothetical protein
MQEMSTKMQVEWCRTKVLELLGKDNSQSEIAKVLQVDLSTISQDISYVRQQSKENIRKYIDERLPEELLDLLQLQKKHGIQHSKQKIKEKRYRHYH